MTTEPLTPIPPTSYYTCEDCIITLQNPDEENLLEFFREHAGHKTKKDIKMHSQLYDLGYNDLKKAEELAQIAKALDAVIVDIRFMPHTRNPEFGKNHLQEILGKDYIHVGALGNKNYRGEGEIQLVNTDEGMNVIHKLLETKSVILMCACWKRSECHRLIVANEYEARHGITTTPITKSQARMILANITAESNPQLPLFPKDES